MLKSRANFALNRAVCLRLKNVDVPVGLQEFFTPVRKMAGQKRKLALFSTANNPMINMIKSSKLWRAEEKTIRQFKILPTHTPDIEKWCEGKT